MLEATNPNAKAKDEEEIEEAITSGNALLDAFERSLMQMEEPKAEAMADDAADKRKKKMD